MAKYEMTQGQERDLEGNFYNQRRFQADEQFRYMRQRKDRVVQAKVPENAHSANQLASAFPNVLGVRGEGEAPCCCTWIEKASLHGSQQPRSITPKHAGSGPIETQQFNSPRGDR